MHQRSDNTLLARSSLRRNIVVCKKLPMTRTLFRTETAYHVAISTLPTMADRKPLFRTTPLTLRSLFLLEHIHQSLIAWERPAWYYGAGCPLGTTGSVSCSCPASASEIISWFTV